jgi:hypothetical protein
MQTVLVDWPYLALAASLLGFGALLLKPHPGGYAARFHDRAWLFWVLLPMYMLHQFEEHGVNALGHHYAFLGEVCAMLHTPLGAGCPADQAFIFAVNPVTVWVVGLVAGLVGPRFPMVAACAFGIPVVNAMTHIGSAVMKGSYNSGLLTSIVLFVPVCAFILRELFRQGVLDRPRLAAVLLTGVVLHVLLVGGLLLRERNILGPITLVVFEGALFLVPIGIGLAVGTPRAARTAA